MGNFYYSRFLDNCDRVVRWESDDERVTWHLWLSRSLRGRVSTKTVQCSYIRLAHWMPEFSTFFHRTIAAVKTDKYGRTPRIFPTACRPRKTARIEHRTCRRWVTLRLIHPVYCASWSETCRNLDMHFWDILWVDDFKDFKSCLHGTYMLKVGQGQPFCWCWLR